MNICTVTTGHMIMPCFSFGEGKRTMVILPGLDTKSILSSARAVESAYRMFSEEFTVYTFGRREDMPDGYTVFDMAQDTAAAMKELSLSNSCIFGASQGGMIAQYLAIRNPELVSRMALGSTLCRSNPQAEEVLQSWITYAEKKDRRGLSREFVRTLYSEPFQKRFGSLLITLNDDITDEDLRRFVIGAKAIRSFDTSEKLKKITCPVLVIGSMGDRVTGARASFELAYGLGCELYMYDSRSAHCVFDEAPDYKNRLFEFFTRQRQ